MRRLTALLASATAVALITAVAAMAAPASSSTPTINLAKTKEGKILEVNGFVVYLFTHDQKNQNSCENITGCPAAWPALTTSGTPKAGKGVKKSLLGAITISGGKKQVTYAGHALYKYAFGAKHSTSYVGVSAFGGTWEGVTATGKGVK